MDTTTGVKPESIKISSPLSDPNEVKTLVSAGASEIYCGLLPDSAAKKRMGIEFANRRDDDRSNLKSPHELSQVVKTAHDAGVKVFLTLNNFYTPYDAGMVRAQAKEAAENKVDAIIVSDISVLGIIREEAPQVPLHLSTLGGAINSRAVLFYRSLGFSRIILPRHMTLREIASLIAATQNKDEGKSDITFEAFVLNDGCFYEDGLCGFIHGIPASLAKIPVGSVIQKKLSGLLPEQVLIKAADRLGLAPCRIKESQIKTESKTLDVSGLPSYLDKYTSMERLRFKCGLCAIRELAGAGVSRLKIAGRGYASKVKEKEVKAVKGALEVALSEKDLQKSKSKYRELFKIARGFECSDTFCYYSSG